LPQLAPAASEDWRQFSRSLSFRTRVSYMELRADSMGESEEFDPGDCEAPAAPSRPPLTSAEASRPGSDKGRETAAEELKRPWAGGQDASAAEFAQGPHDPHLLRPAAPRPAAAVALLPEPPPPAALEPAAPAPPPAPAAPPAAPVAPVQSAALGKELNARARRNLLTGLRDGTLSKMRTEMEAAALAASSAPSAGPARAASTHPRSQALAGNSGEGASRGSAGVEAQGTAGDALLPPTPAIAPSPALGGGSGAGNSLVLPPPMQSSAVPSRHSMPSSSLRWRPQASASRSELDAGSCAIAGGPGTPALSPVGLEQDATSYSVDTIHIERFCLSPSPECDFRAAASPRQQWQPLAETPRQQWQPQQPLPLQQQEMQPSQLPQLQSPRPQQQQQFQGLGRPGLPVTPPTAFHLEAPSPAACLRSGPAAAWGLRPPEARRQPQSPAPAVARVVPAAAWSAPHFGSSLSATEAATEVPARASRGRLTALEEQVRSLVEHVVPLGAEAWIASPRTFSQSRDFCSGPEGKPPITLPAPRHVPVSEIKRRAPSSDARTPLFVSVQAKSPRVCGLGALTRVPSAPAALRPEALDLAAPQLMPVQPLLTTVQLASSRPASLTGSGRRLCR